MNLMGYDAVTLGNHEFDYGLEVLEEVVKAAHFPIVSSNYDFSKTPLAGKIKPYLILKRGGVKIGVMGINIQPKGLVSSANYDGHGVSRPGDHRQHARLPVAHTIRVRLGGGSLSPWIPTRHEAGRGFPKNIDIIIGGHSHTYMEEPDVRKNMDNREVLIYQTAGRGVYVGRIDVTMEKNKEIKTNRPSRDNGKCVMLFTLGAILFSGGVQAQVPVTLYEQADKEKMNRWVDSIPTHNSLQIRR